MNDQNETKEPIIATDALGNFIAGLAQTAESDRTWIEDRWLEDIRQLQDIRGISDDKDPDHEHRHNITKSKTLTAEARISDMLFQQGDKNFSIDPDKDTPAELRDQMEQASDLLEKSIENKLSECDYESVGRKAIKYACELGVGVIQGPIVGLEMEKEYQQEASDNAVINTLVLTPTKKARTGHVPTWDYFPDMTVDDKKSCGYEFRRRWMSKSDMQKLLMRDDFNKQAISEILSTEPYAAPPRHLVELRDESLPQPRTDQYKIWEGFVKIIPADLVRELCQQGGKEIGNHYKEDKLSEQMEMTAHVYVSDSGKLLKFAPVLLDTEESPFSVFCYDRDLSCFMASKGIPRSIRNSQKDVNGSWQRIHDNSDLAVGPQWVADDSIVEPIPIEGKQDWNMTANKGWRLKKPGADPTKAFHFFNVPSFIEENMVILNKSLEFADTESQLPQIASGEQSQGMTKTFQGMELLINASNTVQRRIIKDWDDHVTTPLIGRFIDYVMQYEPEHGVFGKFVPNAQGTSSLLLKETMSRNALNLVQVASGNPKFAERTNWTQMYDQIIRNFMFDPKVVTYTDEELKKQQEKNPPQPSSEMIEAQANLIEAKNEQQKLQQNVQESKHKQQLEIRELVLKEKKAKAETTVAMAKVQLERDKLERDGKLGIVKEAIKGKNKEKEIKTQAKAKESGQVKEYLLERQSGGKIKL